MMLRDAWASEASVWLSSYGQLNVRTTARSRLYKRQNHALLLSADAERAVESNRLLSACGCAVLRSTSRSTRAR